MGQDRVLLMSLLAAQTQMAIGCTFPRMLSVASLEDDFFNYLHLEWRKILNKLGSFKVRNMDCLRGEWKAF